MKADSLIVILSIFSLFFLVLGQNDENLRCDLYLGPTGSDNSRCGSSYKSPCATIDASIKRLSQLARNATSVLCVSASSSSSFAYDCPSIPFPSSVSFVSIDGIAKLNCTDDTRYFEMNGNENQTDLILTFEGFNFIVDPEYGPAVQVSAIISLEITNCTFSTSDDGRRVEEAQSVVRALNVIDVNFDLNTFFNGIDVHLVYDSSLSLPYLNVQFTRNLFSGSYSTKGIRITHQKAKMTNSFIQVSNNTFSKNCQFGVTVSYLNSSSASNVTHLFSYNRVQNSYVGLLRESQKITPFNVSLRSSNWENVNVIFHRNNVVNSNFSSPLGPFVLDSKDSYMLAVVLNITRNNIKNCVSTQLNLQWQQFVQKTEGFAGSGLLSYNTSLEDLSVFEMSNVIKDNNQYGFLDNLIRGKDGIYMESTIANNIVASNNAYNFSMVRWRSSLSSLQFIQNNTFDSNYWSPIAYAESLLNSKPMLHFQSPLKIDEFEQTFCIFSNNIFRRNEGSGVILELTGALNSAQLTVSENIFAQNDMGSMPLTISMVHSRGAPQMLSINKNNFTENYPGALMIQVDDSFTDAKVNVSQNYFGFNQGSYAGAFYVNSLGQYPSLRNNFYVDDCVFEGNVASYTKWPWGGAISINLPNSFLSIARSVLRYNSAFLGGAIGISGSQLTLNNVKLERNKALNGSELAAVNSLDLFSLDSHFDALPGVFIDVPMIKDISFSGMTCPSGHVLIKSFGDYSNVQYKCDPCPEGQYNLDPGTVVLTKASCKPCPDHAVCKAASVVPEPGYWCELDQNGLIYCTACPVGYCKSAPTAWNDTCTASRTGTLCSECKTGQSVSIWSTGCIPNEKCYPGLVSILAVLCVILVLVFVYSALGESSAWKVTVSFVQILTIVLISTTLGVLEPLTLLSFNFNGESSSGGVCVFPGMTQVHKMLSQIGISAGAFAILLVFWLIGRARKLMRKRRKSYYQFMDEVNINADSQDISVIKNAVRFAKVEGSSQFTRGLVALVLFVYFNITIASFRLVDCVSLNRAQILFSAAEVVCYQVWQIPFFILILTILLPFPFLLLLLRRICIKADVDNLHAHAVLRILEGSYSNNMKYWETVMTGRVLVMIIISFFVKNKMWQSVSFTFICLALLIANLMYKPFKKYYAHALETLGLLCLTLISLLEIPKSLFINDPKMLSHVITMTWIQGVCTLIPISFGSAILIVRGIKWIRRKMNQT